jgi:pantoate kinase
VLGDDPGHANLRSYALDVRVFTLQNIDRWPEAELALKQARKFARRTGNTDNATWAPYALDLTLGVRAGPT